ncbi:MAG: IS4 family transposase [Elusimicrobia bacterium]|nr:IS4 family transposase [Elusimicrobiota bacterium]
MNIGHTVFAQVMSWFPTFPFQQSVQRYRGNHRIRTFSCFDQFLCMAFAQLTFRDGLRDIETCLRTLGPKLYHAGIRGTVSRSTLADANEHRDWRIYADLAQVLIAKARRLYAQDDFGVTLQNTVYAFDSTTIDLCLSLFPWARFRKHKAAVKLHTLIDLRGSIPCFIRITDGQVHDVNVLDDLLIEAGAFYLIDRGYIDFERLYVLSKLLAFFVTRAKRNLAFRVLESRPVDKSTGLRFDQTIVLTGPQASKDYPDTLRRIGYIDPETHKRLIFLTNNFDLPALTIPKLYKCRWQVELFFKWIKQYLKIKAFYGTSENAVKTQIWIAIAVYVLIAIIKKELGLPQSLGEILQILSISLFEKMELSQLFSEFPCTDQPVESPNQLTFNDI